MLLHVIMCGRPQSADDMLCSSRIGLSYAGTARRDVAELLVACVMDRQETIELASYAALSLGLVRGFCMRLDGAHLLRWCGWSCPVCC